MRSEPLNPVSARRSEARREGEPAAPADAPSTQAFEAALLRARRGRRGPDDEESAQPDPAPVATLQPQQAALPSPPAPTADALAPRWAPLPLREPDAIARQLQMQSLPDGAGDPGHWQLQITEAGLPVQRLDLQRAAAGPLTVRVSATSDAQQPQHANRLRQRLARAGARLSFRGPPAEQE